MILNCYYWLQQDLTLEESWLGAIALSTGLAFAPMTLILAQAQESEDLPIVKVVATGGTIANTPDGRLSVDAVIEALPIVDPGGATHGGGDPRR